jgi:hypothetical protein
MQSHDLLSEKRSLYQQDEASGALAREECREAVLSDYRYYRFRYIQAASANNTIATIQSDESLIPVFLDMAAL